MLRADEIVRDARRELDLAAETVISQVEAGLSAVARLRNGEAEAAQAVEAALLEILHACSFGDIMSQRLTQLEPFLAGSGPRAEDPLLNGPAGAGGLDQAEVDRLLA